jgi:enterochelin esterase-like enzyme
LDGPNQEAMAIDALTLEQYHEICRWNLGRLQHLYCSTSATANLNAIIVCPSGDRLEDSVEIALLLDAEVYLGHWRTAARVRGEVMEGGWTRYHNFILAAW